MRIRDVELDELTGEVRRGGRPIHLSPTEYALLRYLMVNAPSVVSKSELLDRIWRYDFNGDTSVVESYISYLRKKLDDGGPPVIHTIRRGGYALR